MRTAYRDPQIEESRHTLVLQNRCGNRLSVLCHDDHTELEVVYKPHAARRKDWYARNFSNRDNLTTVFGGLALPNLGASHVVEWDYDPFVTRLSTRTPSQAKNDLTLVNLPDDNAFAIAARCPLLVSVRPHRRFDVTDGLLSEVVEDRGERFVGFVSFDCFGVNRYRVLDDGTHVLQLFENEFVLVGAEDNARLVAELVGRHRDSTLEELVADGERRIAPLLAEGTPALVDPDWQRVADVNRRIVLSGLDKGGACFGALNRIYHLIWVRDGSMTACEMARAGNVEALRTWAPFLLANPTRRKGQSAPEFGQIVGTRWSKNEDDGVFYATWTAFTHFVHTGDDRLLHAGELDTLHAAIDGYLARTWDERLGLVSSDTRGESPLRDNPYFGYDIVTGRAEGEPAAHTETQGKKLLRTRSLYQQLNTYNLLRMAAILCAERPERDAERASRYENLATRLAASLSERFVAPNGRLYAEHSVFDDGSEAFAEYALGVDYWEYAWAVGLGPFYPLREAQIASARHAIEVWPSLRTYGFPPWNTLTRFLFEHDALPESVPTLLAEEVVRALAEGDRYKMRGALAEFSGDEEGWRALPFTAGSFMATLNATLIASLPRSIAVRAGSIADAIDGYRYRTSRIDVRATGSGSSVQSYTLNGRELPGTLVIPLNRLLPGRNAVEIERGASAVGARLRSTTGALLDWQRTPAGDLIEVEDGFPCELCFDAAPGSELCFERIDGTARTRSAATPVRGTPQFRAVAPAGGTWRVTWTP